MAKDVVGLKIGASRLSAARVSVNGGAELVQVAQMPLPRGIVAGGEIRDVAGLASALKTFFERHKLPRRNVRVGVANNRIGVRTIELERIEEPEQLANAIRFRAQEVLPIPLNEAVLDFHVVSHERSEGGPGQRVLLAVAYRDLIDGYVHASRQAGIRLSGIDLEAFALLRALVSPMHVGGEIERSAAVAVAIGAERSTLAVSDGTSCEFTRVIDWGGDALTAAIRNASDTDANRAEELKTSLTLGVEAVPGLTPEQSTHVHENVKAELKRFAREVVSTLQFYQNQPGSYGIREIVLAGGTAQLRGLDEALRHLVGVSVRVGYPSAAVALGKAVDTAPDPSFAIPIGLGMVC